MRTTGLEGYCDLQGQMTWREKEWFSSHDPMHLVAMNAIFSHEMHDGEIRLDFFKKAGVEGLEGQMRSDLGAHLIPVTKAMARVGGSLRTGFGSVSFGVRQPSFRAQANHFS